ALSMIASVVLISVLSWGTVPLVFAVLAGAATLLTTGYVYYKMQQKKQRLEEDFPTLEYLKKKISIKPQESPIDDAKRSLIKRLAKDNRKKIKQELAKSAGIVEGSRRELSEEDRALDAEHTFAEKLFERSPHHNAAGKAALKIWKESRSEAMRGLYE